MWGIGVRVLIFLWSGLFCCLGFSGVVWAGAWAPPKQQKQKKHAPYPSDRFSFFVLFRRVGVRGVRVFFCCLGGWLFFFAVWAGDGSSLTYRSAWLVFKGPNNKKDQTAKKKHGFRVLSWLQRSRVFAQESTLPLVCVIIQAPDMLQKK